MNNQFSVDQFKVDYCTTILTAPDKTKFIQLPVTDYSDIAVMQSNILEALEIITASGEYIPHTPNRDSMIQDLLRIIRALQTPEELEGIQRLIKS